MRNGRLMYRLLASENGFVHVCGHRGHSIGAPENTLAALTATRDNGGSSVEIDCQLTSDGEIVLLHDDFLDRTTSGRGLPSKMTWKEMRALDAGSWFDRRFAGERVPTLAETLDHAKRLGLVLVIEIKEEVQIERFLDVLAKLIGESDIADHSVFISFDHTVLQALKTRAPKVRTEGITHARHADIVGVAKSAGLDSLSIEHGMFRLDDSRKLHDAGIAIRVHIPKPETFNRYAAAGLDWRPDLQKWIAAGAIDTISGDDVSFIADLVASAGKSPRVSSG
jgi:glycerophosphoryl diester phosphodiesterase